jgi:hypothetical protein
MRHRVQQGSSRILFFRVRHPGWNHCSDVFVYHIADYLLKSSLSPRLAIIPSAFPSTISPYVFFTPDSYHYIQFALYALRLVVQIFDLPSPTCVATIWLPVHEHPTLYKNNPPRQKHEMCSGPKETSRNVKDLGSKTQKIIKCTLNSASFCLHLRYLYTM